jgi:single-stranded-DNA-specific exonuclease
MDPDKARSFLNPRLTDMADPMLLKGMEDAVAVILKAIRKSKEITIYGDYDADGLTAAALLLRFFSFIGLPVSAYIPDRLREGYGLHREAVQEIAKRGCGLIITVDCGVGNSSEIAFAKEMGMEVVVTDHHQVPEDFQGGCPVVNPRQLGCSFLHNNLAGVGVAFFLVIALRRALRQESWFESRPEPDLKEYLDLVSLGTVADRAPLQGQNRMLVKTGMRVMARSRWPGMRALMKVSGLSAHEIGADDLAFRLGPRLNAPGRMGDPEIGLKLLMEQDLLLAKDYALDVDGINNRRQSVEQGILDQIDEMIRAREGVGNLRSLLLAGEDWHRGVLGIVASRLVDRYHRPTLVLSIQNGVAVGSGRSIDGFNLYGALSRLSHVFEKFGGHAHAAGFTLKAGNVERLERGLEGITREVLNDVDLVPTVKVDAELGLQEIDSKMIRHIDALSPFGAGNPEPLFLARSLEVLSSRIVGERHLKLRVGQGKKDFEAIGFGLAGRHPLQGRAVNLVFTPELNRWQGYEQIQLRIADLEAT